MTDFDKLAFIFKNFICMAKIMFPKKRKKENVLSRGSNPDPELIRITKSRTLPTELTQITTKISDYSI